jgi:hypothetical protein
MVYKVQYTFVDSKRGSEARIKELWAYGYIGNPSFEEWKKWLDKGEGHCFMHGWDTITSLVHIMGLKHDPYDSAVAGWAIFKRVGAA